MNQILLFRGKGGKLFAQVNGRTIDVPFHEDSFILPFAKDQISIDNRTGENLYYVYWDNSETVFKLTLQSQQVYVKTGGGRSTNGGGGATLQARNGTSVSGGFVELGGSPLIHNTNIDFNTFNLSFTNVPVSVDPASFLTLDAGGNIQANPTGASNGLFWALNGNVTAGEYIGTNNAQDFPIYTSGVERARVAATGQIGINTAPVIGTQVTVQSGGTTNATWIEQWYNATGAPVPTTILFGVRDDGYITAGIANGSMTIGLGSAFSSAVSSNTFLGVSVGGAATGGSNTGVGNEALFSLTTGTSNVAIGVSALRSNSSGTDNTAVGNGTLTSNTTGGSNTAIGMSALTANVGGVNNTAVGAGALDSNTSGTNNTAVGVSPLQANTTGEQNTAIGSSALNSNITGNRNIGIGFEAGYFETGSDKLFIDNQQRADEAGGRATALVYSKMAGATPAQSFNVNANLGIGLGQFDNTFGTDANFVLGFAEAAPPTTSPNGIGQLYMAAGALVYRGGAGTVTVIAPS